MSRRYKILVILMLAVAVPATAQTFGFSLGAAAPACLSIGNTTYRVASDIVRPDVTVRIDPASATPDVRIELAETADEADFVFVDDNAPPACRQGSIKSVRIDAAASAPDLVVGFGAGPAPAYRIYVRSRWLAPDIVAGLFAAAHMPMRTLAGRADRSN